jgi:hypothetical protein
MPSHILVRRHAWAGGLVYTVVGGVESGRTLTAAQYAAYVDAGVPVVRR